MCWKATTSLWIVVTCVWNELSYCINWQLENCVVIYLFLWFTESHTPPGPDDISQYPSDGPTQPNIVFPMKKQDCNRSFKSSWYKAYPWLEYSEKCDAAFCFACRHFLATTVHHAEEAFTSTGFSNWKKALGKKGKITKHVAADYHTNSMIAWASFKESKKVSFSQFR